MRKKAGMPFLTCLCILPGWRWQLFKVRHQPSQLGRPKPGCPVSDNYPPLTTCLTRNPTIASPGGDGTCSAVSIRTCVCWCHRCTNSQPVSDAAAHCCCSLLDCVHFDELRLCVSPSSHTPARGVSVAATRVVGCQKHRR